MMTLPDIIDIIRKRKERIAIGIILGGIGLFLAVILTQSTWNTSGVGYPLIFLENSNWFERQAGISSTVFHPVRFVFDIGIWAVGGYLITTIGAELYGRWKSSGR